MNNKLADLIIAMTEYDKGDAERIQHFMKVHNYAAVIGISEGLDDDTQFILEAASILHDIGIHNSEKKYGSEAGHYQEIEGPPEAEKLMRELGGFSEEQIERVKYLIGHHHTYDGIDGQDYQILIEADFLVNLYDNADMFMSAQAAKEKVFKTECGLKLLEDTFLCKKYQKKP